MKLTLPLVKENNLCWFCHKDVKNGFVCEEWDYVMYHKECGDKISTTACAVCIGEGLKPCCRDEGVTQ
jgi:hypothetical protein